MNLKLVLVTAVLMVSGGFVYSVTDDRPKSIDAVMSEIRTDLGIKKDAKIDPSRVSSNRLEELGDSVMEVMAGTHETHERMEKWIGGEGSPALIAMHQRMGYQYLSGMPLGFMGGMMRGFFDGRTNGRGGFMMGNWGMMGGFGYFGFLMGLLILALIVLAIFLIVRAVSGKTGPAHNESALDILKKRYAKGEIAKDDFERMKKDL